MPPELTAQIALDLASIGKLGEVAIVSLAVIILSLVLLRVVKNMGEGDKQDKGLLKQMIDLATSYKSESAESRDAYKQEAAATREVIHESNDIQRQTNTVLTELTKATNEQTGEVRLLRKDFSAFSVLQTDTTAALVDRFNSFDTQFEGLKALIERNAGDHTDIKDALLKMAEGIKAMHDDVLKLLPVSTITNIVNTAPAAPDASADTKAGDTPALGEVA